MVSTLPANLGPNQENAGRVLWWRTWRRVRWEDLPRSRKNIESKKSMNFEMKNHQERDSALRAWGWPEYGVETFRW